MKTRTNKKHAKIDNGPSLAELMERFNTPETARAYLESLLWADGRVCPHCGVVNDSADLQGAAHDKGLYWCRACEKNFTVTIGTIFEDSKIPLHKWVIAYHLMAANKKGVSALSLQRMLGLGSYRSAWHMAHRIRETMKDTSTDPMGGVVEVDETFIGGKEKNKHKNKRQMNATGTMGKTPVVALVQRGGNVRARAVTNVDETNIGPILKQHVADGAILMTDGAVLYTVHARNNPRFAAHKEVNHGRDEYVRMETNGFVAHTNTVEAFNATVKRCIIGAWHNVSDRHLDRYLSEVSFRWNTRDVSDGERMEQAIRQSEGRRLPLKPMKASPTVDSSGNA